MLDAAPLILAEDLTRRFGDFVAVDHIHVTVQPGEVFGLLGANGAGKTTAIRMLCGMLPPTAGRIQVADVDMVRQARRARGQIGYVAQRFSLYSDLTVLENLKLQAGLYGLTGARRRDRLEEALRLLNLSEHGRSWPAPCHWVTSSDWDWRRRCCTNRGCCFWTSRPRAWTRWPASDSGN